MLVLTRKVGDKIFLSNDVTITVVEVDRGKVRIGVDAPKSVAIQRDDIIKKTEKGSSK